jgi:hypothetical protein
MVDLCVYLYFNMYNYVEINQLNALNSGFGGLVVSMLASGTQVRGFKPGRNRRIFWGEKNPRHAFFRKGSKAVCPMSQICGMLKNPVITWKLGHRQNLSAISSPISSLANRGGMERLWC